tara:strand:+ start:74 stop:589 length:516 start_codon:yes stop_codon:yes gene_type:complete
MLIRKATNKDMPTIQSIYAYHVKHGLSSWEETPPDLEELIHRRNSVLTDGFPYLVAEIDDDVLGFAYASKYRPRPAYRYCCEDSIYVANNAQRNGIGFALLDALIERCTDMQLRRMVAIIGNSANRASIGLHEKAGFMYVGTIPSCGFKHSKWVDQVIMQRALGPGDTISP